MFFPEEKCFEIIYVPISELNTKKTFPELK